MLQELALIEHVGKHKGIEIQVMFKLVENSFSPKGKHTDGQFLASRVSTWYWRPLVTPPPFFPLVWFFFHGRILFLPDKED